MTDRHSRFGIALVSLAFFFFLLMECTLYYQAAISPYPSHDSFLTTQLPVLGASALGYLTFPVYARRVKRMGRRVLAVVFTAVGLMCLAAEYACPSEHGVFWMGCLSFYLLGIAGGGSLWACSVVLSRSTHVALWVAACHAAGMAAQTALSQLPLGSLAETLLVGGAIVAFVAFTMATWPSMKSPRRLPQGDDDRLFYERKPFPYRDSAPVNPNAAPIKLALIVCVVIGIFSLLFNLLYCAVPDGSLSVAERTDVSSRIALIAGGLAMGFIINIGNGKHLGAAILCVALVAAAAAFASHAGASRSAFQVLFYIGWGAFAVFYTMSTIWIAPFMKVPQLWAGIGRVVVSVVTLVTWAPSASLAGRNDETALMIATLALLVAVVIAMNSAQEVMPRQRDGAFVVDDLRVALDAATQADGAREREEVVGREAVARCEAAGDDARGRGAPAEPDGTREVAAGCEIDGACEAIAGRGAAGDDARGQGVARSAEEADDAAADEAAKAEEAKRAAGFAEPVGEAGAPPSPEELLEEFARIYGLTPRETDVLAAVVHDERPLKQIAADLDVTIRTVQRHLTSIYQKTGTQTRAGLAVCFYYAGKQRPRG